MEELIKKISWLPNYVWVVTKKETNEIVAVYARKSTAVSQTEQMPNTQWERKQILY